MPVATVRVRVPFVDVDSSQRIHFTAMFRYMEVAEHELMRSISMPYATALNGHAYPRVHLSCDFQGAVSYDDELEIEARVADVGRSSWSVGFTAYRIPDGADRTHSGAVVVARGRMTIVSMDPETERAIPLPEPLRERLLHGDRAS